MPVAKRHILRIGDLRPAIASSAFVGAGAVVVGDVTLSDHSSIWYGAVVRGDVAPVHIGPRTNIQDGAVIHVSRDRPAGTTIGSNVTIGHLALIHACTLEDECMIGMKACVMDGAVIQKHSWIAAGALVTPGKRVLSGQLWSGTPARHSRDLRSDEIKTILQVAQLYVDNAINHRHSQHRSAARHQRRGEP
jgi:carbonic anhydrase/acetyltransferase-like protein (isoleucine patch superfamily)